VQPPSEAFEEARSTISFDLQPQDGVLVWGTTAKELHRDGVTISLVGGFNPDNWSEASFIVDDHEKPTTNIILTESSTKGKTPIEVHLKTKKNIRPGSYTTSLTFTYFNGQNWVAQSSEYDFIVLSFYGRHQLLTWIVGILVSLVLFLINLFTNHPDVFKSLFHSLCPK